MAYSTGTLANTHPASNLVIQTIEPAMITAGWTKNTANFTANGLVWNVYKSPGVSNNIGKDWFLALGWTTESANGNLQMTIFESWNVGGSNLASNYPPNTNSMVPAANGVCNVNQSALPNVVGSNIGYIATGSTANGAFPDAPTMTWYQSITIDRVILAGCNTSNTDMGYALYAGMYDSLWRTNTAAFGVHDTMPICLVNLQSGRSIYALPPLAANVNTMPVLYTREIGQFGTVAGEIASNFTGKWMYNLHGFPTGTSVDAYTKQYWVDKLLLTGRQNYVGFTTHDATFRGTLQDVWAVPFNIPIYKGDIIQFTLLGSTVTATSMVSSIQGQPALGPDQGWYPCMAQV